MAWKILLCILFGYLIGGINPSYIIGRIKGFDIRKKGSGNAGASNAIITMGKKVGIISAVLDIMKAFAAYMLAPLIFRDVPLAAEIAGVACMLGHMFPVYMKFKGGKGLACLGGVLLAIDWRLFLLLLALEIGVCVLVNYICVVPLSASVIIPVIYGLCGSRGVAPWLLHAEGGWWGVAVLAVGTVAIWSRHIQNLHRIAIGAEMHFNYLWSSAEKKEAEKARITQNKERYLQKKQEKKAAEKTAK